MPSGSNGKPDHHKVELGVQVVKVGSEGKEHAVLVRKGAVRWLCLLATALVLGGGGAWYAYESRAEQQAEMGRLTRLLRSTGERVQALRRVSDRLDDSSSSDEVKEKIAKDMKLESEVHEAQEEHTRAQAAMMKRGVPSDENADVAAKAAEQVPADVQRAMLHEFHVKGSFLIWASAPERAAAWRASPHFGKPPAPEVEDALDDLEDEWEDGELDSTAVVAWMRGNITAGLYPPPINVLSGVAGYLEELTGGEEDSLFMDWEPRKLAQAKSHQENFKAAEATIKEVVASAAAALGDAGKDVTPAFKQVYAALVGYHLTEWLFPGDDPTLDEGTGTPFYKHRGISEAEEDDDDGEDAFEYTEHDDDEAE